MCKKVRFLVGLFAFVGLLFSFFSVLFGDFTAAPVSGSGIITDGVNLNDVIYVVQSKSSDIYTLGATCVQKFDKAGNFIRGAYFDSNEMKRVTNSEFLSLNNDKIIVFDDGDNKITTFDEDFNTLNILKVDSAYSPNDFYAAFPSSDKSKKSVKLMLSNYVRINNEEIELDAPRNPFTSRNGGFIILILSAITLLYIFKDNFNLTEE